jgi:hypothetical protein
MVPPLRAHHLHRTSMEFLLEDGQDNIESALVAFGGLLQELCYLSHGFSPEFSGFPIPPGVLLMLGPITVRMSALATHG